MPREALNIKKPLGLLGGNHEGGPLACGVWIRMGCLEEGASELLDWHCW